MIVHPPCLYLCIHTNFNTRRNPRDVFPTRDDFIRSSWVQAARTQRAQEYEELYPYFSDAAQGIATVTASPLPNKAGVSQRQVLPCQQVSHDLASYGEAEEASTPITTTATNTLISLVGTNTREDKRSEDLRDHIGVGVGQTKVVEARRAFRRLEPEKMFRAPRAEGEPIWAYWGGEGYRERGTAPGEAQDPCSPPLPPGKRAGTTKGFVLVPAKELEEVRALEGALRQERSLLKAHCLVSLDKGEVQSAPDHTRKFTLVMPG